MKVNRGWDIGDSSQKIEDSSDLVESEPGSITDDDATDWRGKIQYSIPHPWRYSRNDLYALSCGTLKKNATFEY